jgi:predicted transcriptional regulator
MPREPNHKSGVINKQDIFAKMQLLFTVNKIGKKIDDYYARRLQLYLEG